MFRVFHSQRDGVDPFPYCTPQLDISYGLLSDTNIDGMQNLLPRDVYVPI